MWTSLGALILLTLVCPLASKDSHAKSHVQNAFTSPQYLQESYALQYQIEIQKKISFKYDQSKSPKSHHLNNLN